MQWIDKNTKLIDLRWAADVRCSSNVFLSLLIHTKKINKSICWLYARVQRDKTKYDQTARAEVYMICVVLEKGVTHTHTHHNRIFQVWYSSKCVRASCDGWWWGINMYMWCVCAISIPRLVMMMIWLMCDVMWWTQMGSDHKHTNKYTNIRVSCVEVRGSEGGRVYISSREHICRFVVGSW